MCADGAPVHIHAPEVYVNHTYLMGDQHVFRGKAPVCDASCVKVG